jgi:hypothetical protein
MYSIYQHLLDTRYILIENSTSKYSVTGKQPALSQVNKGDMEGL